jgi:hypothetical protein
VWLCVGLEAGARRQEIERKVSSFLQRLFFDSFGFTERAISIPININVQIMTRCLFETDVARSQLVYALDAAGFALGIDHLTGS